jgi:hypothetical protein
VDSEVDTRLDRIATSQATQLKGKAAIANARLAYQAYEEVIASQRWQKLAGLGAQPQLISRARREADLLEDLRVGAADQVTRARSA